MRRAIPLGRAPAGGAESAGRLTIARNPVKRPGWRQRLCAVPGAAILLCSSHGAFARSDSAAADGLDGPVLAEIRVTAQKREETLGAVPISIGVLGGDGLDASTQRGAQAELGRVAGVTLDATGTQGGSQLAIRGVAAAASYIAGSSPVGFYLDGVPFAFVRQAAIPDASAYDLDRIEVLRGPQGTLYGVNAEAGVVRILTRDPELDRFEMKLRGDVSGVKSGGLGVRGDAAVNLPVIGGALAVRVVAGYERLAGWIDKPTRADANDGRAGNLRVKVGARPAANLTLVASAWISRVSFGAYAIADATSRGASTVRADSEPSSSDFDSYSLKLALKLPDVTLTATSGYIDFVSQSALGQASVNSVTRSLATTTLPARFFSQEIGLASRGEGVWRWTAGAAFRHGDDRLLFDVAGLPFASDVQYLSTSWAFFGELTRQMANGAIELTAGLRRFGERQTMTEAALLGTGPAANPLVVRKTFGATTPRAILTWHPGPGASLYASYSKGFRSGLPQSPSVVRAFAFPETRPDRLSNLELGAKGSAFGGRVNFDLAGYYMHWKQVQVPLAVPILNAQGSIIYAGVLLNGASASGPGLDASLTIVPARGITIGGALSWNDLTLDREVLSAGIRLLGKGDRLNKSVRFTGNAFASYVFPLGSGKLQGEISAALSHASALPARGLVGAAIRDYSGQAIATLDVRLGLVRRGHWCAAVFAINLADCRSTAALADGVAPFANVTGAYQVRPRTLGASFGYEF